MISISSFAHAADLTTGLVHRWKFDNSLTDDIGAAATNNIGEMYFTGDLFGVPLKCISKNSENERVEITDDTELDGGNFSIFFISNFTAKGSGWTFMSKANTGDGWQYGYYDGTSGGYEYSFYFFTRKSGSSWEYTFSDAYNYLMDNKFHSVGLVVNKSNVQFFADGKMISGHAYTNILGETNTNTLKFGVELANIGWSKFSFDEVYGFSSSKAGEDFLFYNQTVASPAAPSIINSSFNVTNYADLISNSTAWNTGKYINVSRNAIASTFSLNIGANATCSIHNLNYTDMIAMNSNYALLSNAVPLPTVHSFLLFDNLSAYNSTTCTYCAYYDGTKTSQSGCLKTMFSDIYPPANTFFSQEPSDLRDTNAFGSGLKIIYNVTDRDSSAASAVMNAYANTTSGMAHSCIRDSCSAANFSMNPLSNSSGLYIWNLSDNQIYSPSAYNIRQDYMQNTLHSVLSSSQSIKIDFTQISPSYPYNFLEVMANGISGLKTFYYCNSSYSSTSFLTSPNCASFAVLNFSTPYNHIHTAYSAHNMITMPISSGHIGSIAVTNISHIIIASGAAWNYSYISNNSNTFSASNNNGNTWNIQPGTLDSHIHQFSPENKLCYDIASSDLYGNANRSELRCDNIDISRFPPSSPQVFLPNSSVYAGEISINYTEAVPFSPIDTHIAYYDISLYTEDDIFYSYIGNNSLSLSMIYNISAIPDGNYKVYAAAYDNDSFSSAGISEIFTIDNPIFNITIIRPSHGSWFMLKDTIFLEAVCLSDENITKMNVSIYDSIGNIAFSETDYNSAINASYVFADGLVSDIYTAEFTCTDIIGDTISNIITFPVYYYFHLDMFMPPEDITYFWVKEAFDTYEVITGFNITLAAICSDYIDGVWQGESWIDPYVIIYNSYVLPIGTYNLTRYCYIPDTFIAQSHDKIVHIKVPSPPSCILSISTPFYDEKITTKLNITTDANIEWLLFMFNGTVIYNKTINSSDAIINDTIKNTIAIDESFEYGYNFSDVFGNEGNCINQGISIERPIITPPLMEFGVCPSTTHALIFLIFVFVIGLLLIIAGFAGASTLGIVGCLFFLFISFSAIACNNIIGVMMILVSLLILLGFTLRMISGK